MRKETDIMQFESMQALVFMGGHGQYVWLAYAITVILGASLVLVPVFKKRRLLNIIQQIVRVETE